MNLQHLLTLLAAEEELAYNAWNEYPGLDAHTNRLSDLFYGLVAAQRAVERLEAQRLRFEARMPRCGTFTLLV